MAPDENEFDTLGLEIGKDLLDLLRYKLICYFSWGLPFPEKLKTIGKFLFQIHISWCACLGRAPVIYWKGQSLRFLSWIKPGMINPAWLLTSSLVSFLFPVPKAFLTQMKSNIFDYSNHIAVQLTIHRHNDLEIHNQIVSWNISSRDNLGLFIWKIAPILISWKWRHKINMVKCPDAECTVWWVFTNAYIFRFLSLSRCRISSSLLGISIICLTVQSLTAPRGNHCSYF